MTHPYWRRAILPIPKLALGAAGLIAALQLGSGCAPLYRERPTAEPFTPASRDSDLIFVRTGDRHYYYVIDPKRQLCFFHSPLYGRRHMVQLDCAQFPDYDRIVAGAEARRGNAAAPTGTPPDEAAPDAAPTEDAPTSDVAPLPPTGAPAETAEEAEGRVYDAFRRAYVQMQCGRREKDEEPLEVILSRFQLDQETWQAHLDAAKEDEATWTDLQTEVDRTCPAK